MFMIQKLDQWKNVRAEELKPLQRVMGVCLPGNLEFLH